MRDVAITFEVDPSHADEVTVDYLPFGTRVLKIRVVNTAGPTDVPLVLRPANMPAPDQNAGRFAGHADDRPDVWITWGGGHELGPCAHGSDIAWQEVCAPLERDSSSYAYLHVTHRPDTSPADLSDATLTLLATPQPAGEPVGCLKINLRVPRGSSAHDAIRPVWQPDADGGWIGFHGSQIPTYLSRWWPEPRIRYNDTPTPDLSIHYQPVSEPADWPWLRLWRAAGVALLGEPGEAEIRLGDQSIMTISGNLEPALFQDRWMLPEVYRFYSPRYVVLRLWFFWLDTRLDAVRHEIHEIPDIERFDVLIDLEKRKALYACTDLHWREMWGTVRRQPIMSHVGLSAGQLLRLLGQRIEDEFFNLLVMWDETEGVVRNPAELLCEELTGHAECDHRVSASEEVVVVRGAGLFAKHSPYFDDETVKLDGRLTSGDVRRS